jgi:hypothetical protein
MTKKQFKMFADEIHKILEEADVECPDGDKEFTAEQEWCFKLICLRRYTKDILAQAEYYGDTTVMTILTRSNSPSSLDRKITYLSSWIYEDCHDIEKEAREAYENVKNMVPGGTRVMVLKM